MKKSWTIKDSYKTYEGKMDSKKYFKVLREIFWEISFKMIRERYRYNMGFLGWVYVTRCKVPKKNCRKKIDYSYYNKTGQIKYYLNMHSDGYYHTFKWKRSVMFRKYYEIYKFYVCRGNDYIIGSRGLSTWIKESSKNPYLKDYTTNSK